MGLLEMLCLVLGFLLEVGMLEMRLRFWRGLGILTASCWREMERMDERWANLGRFHM